MNFLLIYGTYASIYFHTIRPVTANYNYYDYTGFTGSRGGRQFDDDVVDVEDDPLAEARRKLPELDWWKALKYSTAFVLHAIRQKPQ